jgi:nucleoporin NUP82
MLRGLMDKASPELSEYETRWFEELKRMKGEIGGAGRYDEGSLVARTRMVHCFFFSSELNEFSCLIAGAGV